LKKKLKKLKRVCNSIYEKYPVRLIINGRTKRDKKTEAIMHNEVIIVSAQKDATHVVIMSDKITVSAENSLKNCHLPFLNKQWYYDYIKTKVIPPVNEPKYIFKIIEQKNQIKLFLRKVEKMQIVLLQKN